MCYWGELSNWTGCLWSSMRCAYGGLEAKEVYPLMYLWLACFRLEAARDLREFVTCIIGLVRWWIKLNLGCVRSCPIACFDSYRDFLLGARFTQGNEQGGSGTEVTRFLMPCNEEILCCDYTTVYYSHNILYSLWSLKFTNKLQDSPQAGSSGHRSRTYLPRHQWT